jgi:hypothetical protein
VVLYIYERDGGSYKPKLYDLYPGVVCNWPRRSGDDYVDSTVFNINYLRYNYSLQHDIGDAVLKWYKTP